MAADRESTFNVKFDGDGSTLRSVLAGLKSQIKSDVAEIESTTSKVQLFKGLQDNVKAAGDAVLKARDAVVALQQQIDKLNAVGSKPTSDLTQAMAAAEKQVVSLSRQYNSQSDALDRMRGKLTAAGVDVNNLASEELRLASALKTAQTQASLAASSDLLGFKSAKDVAPQIAALRAAFANLQTSGTLSSKEIAAAQLLLQQRIAAVNATVSATGGTFATAYGSAGGLATTLATRFLAPIAIFGSLTAAVRGASETTETFAQNLALIGSITSLSSVQLADLGEKVKALSVSVGFDLNAGLKGLYDLIRSGVPPENALDVLKVSAEAAHASLADVSDGLKAANVLMSAFGVPATELGNAFDMLVQGAKDGGATLAEFAANASPVLSVAKAMNVPLNELIAVLTVMTNTTGDAAGSMTHLQQILTKLDTSEARQKLRDLGIEGTDLVGIFKQLGEKGISLQELVDLGVVSTRSAAGLAALTNSAHQVPKELDRVDASAGSAAEALKKFYDTPQGAAQRFDAQLALAGTRIGDLIGKSSALGQAGTLLLRAFNFLTQQNEGYTNAIKLARGETAQSTTAALAAAAAQSALAAATARSAAAQAQAAANIKSAHQDLTQFGRDLIEQSSALSAAMASDVKDIDARAQAQVDALDRSKAATAATAAATLQIDLQAAAARLAVITKAEQDITDAVTAANAAREKVERDEHKTEQNIASDSAKARIAALGPVLAQYQQHYAALIGLAQNYAAQAQVAEQARIGIANSVAEAIRQIHLAELDGLDQYVAKQQQIDVLISQGREKATQGDITAAKEYFDKAIAQSNDLAEVVDKNGVVVITKLQASTDRLADLKKISDAANESIGAQGDAANAGSKAAIAAADRVAEHIKGLQAQYDDLKAVMAAGLDTRVNLDQQSVASAMATLNALTQPRQVDITVNYLGGTPPGAVPGVTGGTLMPGPWDLPSASASGGTSDDTSNGFARGGPVPFRDAWERFAFGGPVFTGTRVPGTGDTDSFLTTLEGGSFVVRKAAAAHYGDAVMHGISRLASGGLANYDPLDRLRAFQADPDLLKMFGNSGAKDAPSATSDPSTTPGTVIAYALSVLAQYQRGFGPTLIKSMGPLIHQQIDHLQRNPTDADTLAELLKESEYLGANLHLIDYVERSTAPSGALTPPYTFPDFVAGRVRTFARGGPASDTIPAMLTPGEFVVQKSTVDHLGVGLLSAINAMRVPKFELAAVLAPSPPPRPRHFADGGFVGSMSATVAKNATVGSRSLNVTINANAGDLLSTENVRRLLVPTLEDLMRKSRT